MASERPQPTFADYVAVAVSPALIMAMVGSLVFFLLAVCYEGEFVGRLRWILFFFVAGMVLIARISMDTSVASRASLYGLALGIPTYLGLLWFVDYPEDSAAASFSWLINLVLMAIIWWCAHRLTWDCTHVDDEAGDSGKGLLDAAGLDREKGKPAEAEPEGTTTTKHLNWWERYQRYREEQKRRQPLGVWVVYFSLGALPIFGLGQSLIGTDSAQDLERRQHTFWLMGIYVGSGLGLLATTSFLGLRRYLRQRKLTMPKAMTGTWLGFGAALIVALLAAGAILPRPQAEYSLLDSVAKSRDRKASWWSPHRDSPGKDKGSGSDQAPEQRSDEGSGDGARNDPKGKGQSKGNSSGQSSSSNDSGQKSGGSGKDKQNSQNNNASKGNNSQSKGNNDQAKGNSSQDKSNPSNKDGGRDDKDGKADEANKRSGGAGNDRPQDSNRGGRRSSGSRFEPSNWTGPMGTVAKVLKWVVFAALAVAVLYLLIRHGLSFLANFTAWARSLLEWWNNLWGGRKDEAGADADEGEEEEAGPRPRPFASFSNPFRDDRAARQSLARLVRYSFSALQAWAYERDLARKPDETPLEFAERLAAEVPALENETRRLANLYARAEYARGALPESARDGVRAFWDRLEEVAEQPLSA